MRISIGGGGAEEFRREAKKRLERGRMNEMNI
jgi:hypothetical protein